MGLRVSDSSGERFFEGLAGSDKTAELTLTTEDGSPPHVEVVVSGHGVQIRWGYHGDRNSVHHAELKLFDSE